MTKIERLEAELRKLYSYRQAALRRNDLFWLSLNKDKIDRKEKELIEAKRYRPMKLSEVLDAEGPEVKDSVYKALLKISLAADFCDDCVVDAKCVLGKLGLDDFSLKSDVEELHALAQRIASFVIVPNQTVLTDMMCDDSEFVDACHAAADRHLKDKLKL